MQRLRDGWMGAAAAVLAFAFAACGRDGGHGGYVARVNSAILTEADIVHQRDSLGEAGAASREYVNEWVVNELLYQEAERRGVTDAPAFREQLDVTRKRLAVAALLQDAVFGTVDSSAVSEDTIAAVFARSSQAYALHEDVCWASYVLFRDREPANAFRATVLRGSSWEQTLADVQSKTSQPPQVIRFSSRQFFTRSTLYPEELWKLARSLSREDISFPLHTDEGYVVLRAHQNFRQGETPPLDYARAEVREHLLMDLRRARYEEFLGAVRKRYSVDIRETQSGHDPSGSKE